MSYDHCADENGVFEMTVTKRHCGEEIGNIRINGLEPFEKLHTEVTVSDKQIKRAAAEIDAALSRSHKFF